MKSFRDFFESVVDRLPPEPGSVPVSSGRVRLYHQTDDSKADSIRRNGIQKSHSKGKSSQEPVVIWATEDPFYGAVYKQGIATVEFSVPVCDNSARFPCFMKPTYVLGEVVSPEYIIAIHEYWHSIARFLISDYPELDAEVLKLMDGFRAIDEDHRKAVDYYLSHMKPK